MLVIVHTSGQILLDELLFEVIIYDTTHQRFVQRIEIQTEVADTHSMTTRCSVYASANFSIISTVRHPTVSVYILLPPSVSG
jgi:hypothetical protein